MITYPKLLTADAMIGYTLKLTYANGEERLYDFSPNLKHPFYEKLQNLALFKHVSVVDGEIMWATGQDFCPHTLYEKSVPIPA